MLKKFNQLAEQAATSVSRRQFFGRFGRGAVAVAAAMGGMLVLPGEAQAASCAYPYEPTLCPGGGGGRRGRIYLCCWPGSTCVKVRGKFVCG
jgi:hypothetical protein